MLVPYCHNDQWLKDENQCFLRLFNTIPVRIDDGTMSLFAHLGKACRQFTSTEGAGEPEALYLRHMRYCGVNWGSSGCSALEGTISRIQGTDRRIPSTFLMQK